MAAAKGAEKEERGGTRPGPRVLRDVRFRVGGSSCCRYRCSFVRGGSGRGAATPWSHWRQLRGLAKAREPRPQLTKSRRSPWEDGEGRECGAEAWRGPSEPGRPPTAPASPRHSYGGPVGGFPEAAPAPSTTEEISKLPSSEAGMATGRILTLGGSSWRVQVSKSGGTLAAKVAKIGRQ